MPVFIGGKRVMDKEPNGLSRDWQKDKVKGIRMICDTAKSKGETLNISPDFVMELMDEAAAERERADKAEELLKDALGCMMMFAGVNEHTNRIAAGLTSLYPLPEREGEA